MEAIGDLDDRFVLEFAQPEPTEARKETGRVHWMIPVAACLCLLAGALGLYFLDGGRPSASLQQPSTITTPSATRPTVPSEPNATKTEQLVIWAGTTDTIYEAMGGNFGLTGPRYPVGEVTFLPGLQDALAHYPDPDVRFAVQLWGGEDTNQADVYEELGLNGDKDCMTLFLTAQQIRSIPCPEGMALVLGMVRKSLIRDITLDVLDTLEQDTVLVKVSFVYSDIYDCFHQAYDSGAFADIGQMQTAQKAAMVARMESCAIELGLSVEDILGTECMVEQASFTAELDQDQLRRLFTEEQFDNLYKIEEAYADAFCEEWIEYLPE